MQTNELLTHTFEADEFHEDPFNRVALDVLFTDPQGQDFLVPAFWAGGRNWQVRYSSPIAGRHTFVSRCSASGDEGLHGVEGSFEIDAYTGTMPLTRRGAPKVAEDRRHFSYGDGTPFLWLADTWWMGLCKRMEWPTDFKRLAADRKEKGFNVIQIVAGLYPDMPAFDSRGDNEFGWPWMQDYSRVNPEYFDFADRRIFHLADEGFVPCIVGTWGYHILWMGTEKMKQHWRYLIARYAALPVVWVTAGEATMPFYLSEDKEKDAEILKNAWTEVARYIHEIDPFDRMVTAHPSLSARETVNDPTVLDFDMHQTGHRVEKDEVIQPVRNIRMSYEADPVMPVISGESSYDGLDLTEWGRTMIPSSTARAMWWACMMNNGAAGSTYGANGIWQVNRVGQPYGPSPHGRSWGSQPWEEAMQRPASRELGLAKELFEQLPWHRFEPHPEWVKWSTEGEMPDETVPPYAAGVLGEVVVVYALEFLPVEIRNLSPAGKYLASYFDPVTGEQTKIGEVEAGRNGNWRCPSPAAESDWVVILQRRR
ncbi:MAG: DUF4038 domain-containing protein [Planctomycetota bacterium]|nr:DUF4038 domain-containing protein [Planctomycetota bacterium]